MRCLYPIAPGIEFQIMLCMLSEKLVLYYINKILLVYT